MGKNVSLFLVSLLAVFSRYILATNNGDPCTVFYNATFIINDLGVFYKIR